MDSRQVVFKLRSLTVFNNCRIFLRISCCSSPAAGNDEDNSTEYKEEVPIQRTSCEETHNKNASSRPLK